MANYKPNKPKSNHPWRNEPEPKVVKFAKEQSALTGVNNYKVGGGKPQK